MPHPYRRIALSLATGVMLFGCRSTPPEQTQSNQHELPRKPSPRGQPTNASPELKRFVLSHGFHLGERQIYSRQYQSLKEAGEDLGISLVHLPVPPNGTFLEQRDERVFELHNWGFTVLAEKGRTLDDPNTPCIVNVSLFQIR